MPRAQNDLNRVLPLWTWPFLAGFPFLEVGRTKAVIAPILDLLETRAVSLGNFPDFDFTILSLLPDACRQDATKRVTKAALRKLFEIATSGSAVFSHQSEI